MIMNFFFSSHDMIHDHFCFPPLTTMDVLRTPTPFLLHTIVLLPLIFLRTSLAFYSSPSSTLHYLSLCGTHPQQDTTHLRDLRHHHASARTPPLASTATTTPTHVALICDGNSRWAERRRLPATVGHAKGAEALTSVLRYLKSCGVKICTFYGFSTENWSRSADEINDIWTVMERTAKTFHDMAIEENVRVRILGDLDDVRIPTSLRDTLMQLEKDTGGDTNFDSNDVSEYLMVCLAINYGGRSDIARAGKQIADLVKRGELSVDQINENTFSKHLCTFGLPEPSLIIRTGGEQRLSNFLLWDLAYSELYFTDELWPDFDADSVDDALVWYSGRCRRFGGRKKSDSDKVNGKKKINGTSPPCVHHVER